MTEEMKKEFGEKFMTPQEAVRLVKSGDTVYVGCTSSTANILCEALAERSDELEDITLTCGIGNVTAPDMQKLDPKTYKISTFFMGPWERSNRLRVPLDYTSVHLSQIDVWCLETQPPDVAFFEVSLPDENGYMSYGGTGVAFHCFLKESAKKVILQVNKNAPYLYGEDNLIHWSEADAIVDGDDTIPTVGNLPVDDALQTISGYLLDQIPDGACLQLGIGGVANAVGFGLKEKNDLSSHTEMVTDSIMELMKMGVINNSRKSFMPGKTVAAFAYGTEELYRFIDHNPDFCFMPFTKVNNPVNIAKNDNMISINTAMSIDLLGQVCSDNLAGEQYSSTGGQVDFVRGAQMSKGGKSFIAVTSTVNSKKNGVSSRIVTQLPAGSVVTTPRSDVQYVVTEYGCVNLKPLTMKNRVRAMISLAHPDFRPQLTEEAKRTGLL